MPLSDYVEEDQQQQTPPPAAEPVAEKKPEVTPEVKALQKELKAERQRRQEAEGAAKTWYDRAAAAASTPQPKAAEPEPEPEPEIDVIDLLTTKGAKGLEQALDKLGYAKKKDLDRVDANIDRKIGQTRQQITQEAQLYGKYPDLQDEKSEFYETTLDIFKELSADPVMAKSPALVEKAAKMAARILGNDAPKRKPADPEDDDEEADAGERDRIARVGRQSGGGGRRSTERAKDDDPQLERAAQSLVEKFQKAGADLTMDGYKKRAEKGIQMSLRSYSGNRGRR